MTDEQIKRRFSSLERKLDRIATLLEQQAERWLSIKDTANLLGVSRSRVYALVRSGRLESRRDTDGTTRGKICIKQSSITEYLTN